MILLFKNQPNETKPFFSLSLLLLVLFNSMVVVRLFPDILINILRYAAYYKADKPEDWKNQLRLLAINREMRLICVPFVYRHMYAVFDYPAFRRLNEPDDDCSGRTCSYCYKSDSSSSNVSDSDTDELESIKITKYITTNAELVKANGYVGLVKSLTFHGEHEGCPVYMLGELVDYLATVHHQWNTIKCITFVDHCYQSLFSDYTRYMRSENHTRSIVANNIATLFPHVHSIKVIPEYSYTQDSKMFYVKVCKLYSEQLNRLTSTIMNMSVSGTPEFTQLTHLDLNFKGEKGTQIPLACTSTLQHLVISQILVDHNWLAIDPNNIPSNIEFNSLKTLHLTYIDDDPSEFVQTPTACPKWMSHTKVHFPKLAHFYTNNDSDEFPILATCVFPRHIETLDIKAQTKLLRLLVLATWPQTEHLKLTLLPSYTDMDASLFGCIRHLLKSAETSKTAEVAISNDSFVVEQELFAGIRVTHLRLSPPVGFETMVSLVDNMPSLVNLCVYDFESSTVPDKIVDCSDRLAPFSSKLQQLSINCLDEEYPPVRTINAVVYMVKRLTQLKMVKVPISVISVVGLLNKERSMDPHLNNVLFKFTDDGYLDTRTLDIFGNNKY